MVQSSAVSPGINATAAQYNAVRNDVLLGLKSIQSNTDQATVTMDMSVTNDHAVTINASRIIAFSNVTVGQWFHVEITQGAAGNFSVTWPSGIKWPAGSAPPLSTAGGAIDGFIFHCVGSGSYRGYFGGFGLA